MAHADRTGLRVLARRDARNGTGEEPHLNCGEVIFEWQKACREPSRAKSTDCGQIDDGQSAWRRSRVLAPPKSRRYGLGTGGQLTVARATAARSRNRFSMRARLYLMSCA